MEKHRNQTIFFTVPTPTVVRNFFLVPDSVLDQLRKNGATVVLLVAKQAYEEVKRDFGSEQVIVEPTHIYWNKTFISRAIDFFTRHLNFTETMRINATKWGTRIDIPVRERKSYLYFVKAGIAATFGKSWWVRNVLASRLSFAGNRVRPYRDLFEKYQPDAVFVPNVLSEQGLEVLREARRCRIPSVGMSESWDHFPKRYEPVKPDRLLVWHETSGTEARLLQDYPHERIFITGAPHYDLFSKKCLLMSRDKFFKKCGLDTRKKLVALFSSSIYSPDDGDIVSILMNFSKKGRCREEFNLFIRPYPGVKYDHGKFDRYDGTKGIFVDWVDSKNVWGTASHKWYPSPDGFIWTVNIFHHADIIINTYSSVGVEASALLKPIININFDGFQKRPPEHSLKRFEKGLTHYRHVWRTRGVYQTNSPEDLLEAVNLFLENPNANRSHIEQLRTSMCGPVDGLSSRRIAEHIMAVTNAGPIRL